MKFVHQFDEWVGGSQIRINNIYDDKLTEGETGWTRADILQTIIGTKFHDQWLRPMYLLYQNNQ